MNVFFAGFKTLRSLEVPFVPMEIPPIDGLDIDTWLAGKEQLIALMVPLLLLKNGPTFTLALSRLPSLRYLFLPHAGFYWSAEISSHPIHVTLRTILESNRQLHIILSRVMPADPLRRMLREAGLGERVLLLDQGQQWKYGVLEDMVRAYDCGDNNVKEWMTRREWVMR